MTPTTKNALLLIFLAAVCSNASDKWQFDYETGGDENFTEKQRWQTGALNIVPGMGSYFIMKDFRGALVQWILGSAGAISIAIYVATIGEEYSCSYYSYGDYCYYSSVEYDGILITGLALYGASLGYNIYRSITYNKPQKTAYSENSGFNIAVLPNRNGKLNAFLIYNKAF